jgi:hypothetical protein
MYSSHDALSYAWTSGSTTLGTGSTYTVAEGDDGAGGGLGLAIVSSP